MNDEQMEYAIRQCVQVWESIKEYMITVPEAIVDWITEPMRIIHACYEEAMPKCHFCGSEQWLTRALTCRYCGAPAREWMPELARER